MPDILTFEDDRKNAAGLFAQTMIVVDDEAVQAVVEVAPEPVILLKRPMRGTAPPERPTAPTIAAGVARGNHLDAKTLIEQALELGIVCSVLRVAKADRSSKRLIKAAKNADIVSLDWEIEGDGGELAKEIIAGIVNSDLKQNGRIRLISIYTSMRNRQQILKEIRERLHSECAGDYEVSGDSVTNRTERGSASLRIVCLLKTHGVRKTLPAQSLYEFDEKALPNKLLSEFSHLSAGLLGNVAMATIASVRDVTHHVLSTFDDGMDGPYFHHRALIELPAEAEDYAIDLVLSEIKKSVIRKGIKPFADGDAIKRRVKHKFKGQSRTLRYKKPNSQEQEEISFSEDQIVQLIQKGQSAYLANCSHAGITKTTKKLVPSAITSLFEDDLISTKKQLVRFASLSQLAFHPAGHRLKCNDLGPTLTTGTIIQTSTKGEYLICLQALCDTVIRHGASRFIFARLTEVDDVQNNPVFVIPLIGSASEYLILAIDKRAYTDLVALDFPPNPETQMVSAKKTRGRFGFHFFDHEKIAYCWLANAKGRRALRTVHELAHSMSRVGFDEFEPFRAA